MNTDNQIMGVLKTVESFVDTCPDLEDCEVQVSLDDGVTHDGDYHRFAGTVIIDGVEWGLVLERFDD
jgi:hypothetical protein